MQDPKNFPYCINSETPFLIVEFFHCYPDFKVARTVKKYSCCPEPYPELTYTLHLRRRARFFLMNTIVPSTLISFLAFLSFSLPPDSGERIGLVITTLLSLAVFMMIISDQIPPTSEVFPLLQKFLTAVMFEIGIALMANCIVISWASREEPPSKLIKKLFSFEYFKNLLRRRNKAKITSSHGIANKGNSKLKCKFSIPSRFVWYIGLQLQL